MLARKTIAQRRSNDSPFTSDNISEHTKTVSIILRCCIASFADLYTGRFLLSLYSHIDIAGIDSVRVTESMIIYDIIDTKINRI